MKYFSVLLLTSLLLLSGCVSERNSSNKYLVTVYSGGQAVKTYTISDKSYSYWSDGVLMFQDETTGRIRQVSGTVTVEGQP